MATQLRSPNYPRTSLVKIISRLKKYRSGINANVCSQETVARTLGFTGVTGAALPILSALKKFGLLEVFPEGLKFSDTAFEAINLTDKDPQYSDLIEQIAFKPAIFGEIREHFGRIFPHYDQFKDFLLQRGFVSKRVPAIIEIYRQTYELVASARSDYEKLPAAAAAESIRKSRVAAASSEKKENTAGRQEWNFDLADGIQIAVKIAGSPSVSAMNKLADFWKHNENFWKAGEEN